MTNERILAQGTTISNDTRITGLNNNDLIIGSSGSGKTGGYVIPNLQNITGSMVVSDTKGQLEKLFKKELKQKGYKVLSLNVVDPLKSCGYNPLKGIRRHKDGSYCEQDVLTLANNIMPTLDSQDPFWERAAASQIAFYIAYCLDALEPEEQNMITVCDLHRAFISPRGILPFEAWAETHPDTFSAKKFRMLRGISSVEKTSSCIYEFVNRGLELFDFKEARKIFESSESIDIASLGREKTVLFLNVSDTDSTFDRIVNIFYTQALQVLCSEADKTASGRLKVPVRIVMDDFAASAKIPDFEKIISVIRSREISVSLVLQSLTQLESMYKKADATTIINNCDHLLYLGCQDLETADFMGARAYKTPESILSLSREKAILITNGEKAKITDKIKPYSTMGKAV